MSNSNCQFCSQISAQNGEQLIGTAGYHDRWLVVERLLPWSAGILEDPEFKPIVSLLKQIIFYQQIALRALFIAPDREYSIPGFTRIIYYDRAAKYITAFTKLAQIRSNFRKRTVDANWLGLASYSQDSRNCRYRWANLANKLNCILYLNISSSQTNPTEIVRSMIKLKNH